MGGSEREEYKQSWHYSRLSTLCAFANGGDGGTLFIGIDDKGVVTGVRNAKKLTEELPNIIQHKLGFKASVETRAENGKEYVVIAVKPQPDAVSYNGRFYVRSGSTTQEISGHEIVTLQFEKDGISFTDIATDKASVKDLSTEAVEYMVRRGKERGRMPALVSADNVPAVLRHFDLMQGEKLTVAGALLFHPRPSSVVQGAYTEIGVFSEADGRVKLLRDDYVEGPLIMQSRRRRPTDIRETRPGDVCHKGHLQRDGIPVSERGGKRGVDEPCSPQGLLRPLSFDSQDIP